MLATGGCDGVGESSWHFDVQPEVGSLTVAVPNEDVGDAASFETVLLCVSGTDVAVVDEVELVDVQNLVLREWSVMSRLDAEGHVNGDGSLEDSGFPRGLTEVVSPCEEGQVPEEAVVEVARVAEGNGSFQGVRVTAHANGSSQTGTGYVTVKLCDPKKGTSQECSHTD